MIVGVAQDVVHVPAAGNGASYVRDAVMRCLPRANWRAR
jgi:hypothetical protein